MVQVSKQTELQQALDQGASLIHIEDGFNIESQITINYPVTIQSPNGTHLRSLTRQAGFTGKLFSVEAGGELTLRNLILDGDKANTPAAESAISANSILTMEHVMVVNNVSSTNGGGIYIDGEDAVVSMKHCVIQGCECIGKDGGGIFINGSSPSMQYCTFSGNTARGNGAGGGMANSGSSPVLSSCTFSNNAASSGGGMHNTLNSNPTLADCCFSNNTTSVYDGGGIYNSHSSPMLVGCTFFFNSSAFYAGGMYTDLGSPMLTDCTFNCNKAREEGGGVYTLDGSSKPKFRNCTFSYNTAKNGGGMSDSSSPALTNCAFVNNTAQNYGGGLYGSYQNAALYDCTFMNNKAQYGGGMSQTAGKFTLIGGRIGSNMATEKGGGIYLGSEITDSVFTGVTLYCNTSKNGGGVYVDQYGAATFNNSVIRWNTASKDGGGIYLQPNGQAHICAPVEIKNNSAGNNGAGIYNGGLLGVSGAVDIRDGVFPVSAENLILVESPLAGAYIQLENLSYAYPATDQAPISVAAAATDYPHLTASDSMAIKMPPSGFMLWYVRLNEDNTHIQLDALTAYNITYENLMGAKNPNPSTFNALNLPITLWPPDPISGYYFIGWFGADGNQVAGIFPGTACNITIYAGWEKRPESPRQISA